jgi:hypothetical protein
MSDAPRSSIDSRYEREGQPPEPGHELAPVSPPYPHHAISVGLPGQPTSVTYGAPAMAGGVSLSPGAVIPGLVAAPSPIVLQQPLFGLPIGSVTVINNPPPAGAPCPVCGKPLGDPAAHRPHDHPPGPPAAPRFSKATPEVFRDGFKPLWDAALADQAAFVVVSGCNKLLDVLLKDLEAKAALAPRGDRSEPARKGFFERLFAGPPEEKTTFAKRIEKLRKDGILLQSTVTAVKDYGLSEVLNEKIDAASVTSDMARRYVHLLWQVADQGFEQPQWSAVGEPPKSVPGPPQDHGHPPGHGHGHSQEPAAGH